MIRLDTHVVVWLYTGDVERLSDTATALLEEQEPVISPMVELEVTFLQEIGRLSVGGPVVVADLRERLGLTGSGQRVASVVAAANPLSWTHDPFDRLIVGDALAADCPLLTKDRTIRDNCPLARW